MQPEQREGEARQVPMAERLAAQLQEQRVGYVTENDVRRALEAMGLVLTDAAALAASQEKLADLERGSEGDPDLAQFIAFAESLSPDVGPMFGRDAARIARAYLASQEKERQLTEALHRIAHSGGGTFETVDGLRMIALDALDSTQTHGGGEK